MRSFLTRFIVPFIATTLSLTVHADASVGGTYCIKPSSRIGFHVDQVGGGGLDGAIKEVSGQFRIDPANLAHSSVTIDLKAASIATGQSRIDSFLRSNAVFDSDKHPDITFRSTRVVQTGPKAARIEGTLTARGVSRNEAFQAELARDDHDRVVFHVVGNIYRMPYGMGVGVPIYANVVTFDMELEGGR